MLPFLHPALSSHLKCLGRLPELKKSPVWLEASTCGSLGSLLHLVEEPKQFHSLQSYMRFYPFDLTSFYSSLFSVLSSHNALAVPQTYSRHTYLTAPTSTLPITQNTLLQIFAGLTLSPSSGLFFQILPFFFPNLTMLATVKLYN